MRIIPIRDLKNTSEISNLCHQSDDPVFITKNGYGDMVIMSMESYEKKMFLQDVERMLEESEEDFKEGRYTEGFEVFERLKEKYHV